MKKVNNRVESNKRRGGKKPAEKVPLLIVVLSVSVPLAVTVLLLFPDFFEVDLGINQKTLPLFHAVLNGWTVLLLVIGFLLIRSKKIIAHKRVMITAFAFSSIFLVSYIISKLNAAPVSYRGEGWMRNFYFFLLISHIMLSIAVLPLAMLSIYRGLTTEYQKHKKIVRWTFPIWLYVAVTGVLIYLFMAPYY